MSSLPSTVRVLHVDDEPDFADVAATFVEQENDRFEVETAPSASDGLEKLTTIAFDCIVSDYEMPGTDGIEFLETVRETHPDLPFILYTGKGGEEVASDAISAGVTEYLQKDTGTSQYTVLVNRIQNVVEKRETEEQLKQVKTIANALNDAVYVVDEQGQFEYVNDEFTELTGYDRETVLGSTPALIKDEEAVADAETQLGQLLSSEGPDTAAFEVTIHPRDGEPIICEDQMGVLPYQGDYFDGSVGVLRDITDRKQQEERLRRERDRLNEFAGVVSHDLRNPLNVASLSVQLAAQECDSPHLDRAERAHSRMEALIEDLLTLARGGDQVESPEPVVLQELAESAWENVATSTAQVRVETDADRTLLADQSRLSQLFENLYRNAIEHGAEDVTVRVGELAEREGVYIEDDGPGIPADDRETIFETGFSTAEDGTGFGLSIVKQVAEAHGWEIQATTGSDGGARFEITGVEFDR